MPTLSAGQFVNRQNNVAKALARSQNCDDVPKADVDGTSKKMRNGPWTVQSRPLLAAMGSLGPSGGLQGVGLRIAHKKRKKIILQGDWYDRHENRYRHASPGSHDVCR
jgi:hypothetical protein